MTCATMNPGVSAGRIPANVSLAARARVTAGFAKEVEDVNQYAAAMYAPTANGTAGARKRAVASPSTHRPHANGSTSAKAQPVAPFLDHRADVQNGY